jgi:hypothetical protein
VEEVRAAGVAGVAEKGPRMDPEQSVMPEGEPGAAEKMSNL